VENVRLGIVGLGRLGLRHAETIAYKSRGAELVAACSINSDELDRARDQLGIASCFTDFTEMLDAGGIDGVIIVSSSGEHSRQIAEALEAGLHVFSEKPLGVTVDECTAAERAVETHPEQVFMLGFMRRFDPSYAAAKQKIRAGTIGEPFLVRAYGLDPDALIEGAIRFAASSGGIFLDMMIHDIDLARWYLERDFSMVHAIGGTYKYSQFSKHNDVDNAAALMQTSDGKMALFYTGRTAMHGYHIETEVIGTEGAIRIDGVPRRDRAVIYTKNGATEECVPAFPERFAEAFTRELQEFIDCMREGRKPEVSVYDGTQATVVAFAATKSLREKRPVYLD